MNQQSKAYARYLDKFKDNPKYEITWSDPIISKYPETNIASKVETSARSKRVVISPEGNIIELHDTYANGMLVKAFIFKNKEDHNKYIPPMPFNIYHEF